MSSISATRSPSLRWQPVPCAAATSAAYAVLYALSNQLTSHRTDVGAGVFDWERSIPFIGWTIVPYLSIIVFFVGAFFVDTDREALRRHVLRLAIVLLVSLLCYAAFPLRYTFERPRTGGLVGLLFELLGHCDMPYNRAPSLHIGVLVLLWARFAPVLRGAWGIALRFWFALIAVSVLTTYQHHVLDVPAGVAVGILALLLTAPANHRHERPCRAASSSPWW